MLKAHPPPTLHFLSLAVLPTSLRASYLSFIAKHFRPENLLQLFFSLSQTISLFIPTKSPLLIPLILLLPFLNLSHRLIRSRITHECGMVVPMPALCQSAWVCLCGNLSLVGSPCSGGPGLRISPRKTRLVSGQVKLCEDYRQASWESVNKFIVLAKDWIAVCLKITQHEKDCPKFLMMFKFGPRATK